MDLINTDISYDFLRAHTNINWSSLRFGLRNGLISYMVPIKFAIDQSSDFDIPNPKILDLSTAKGEELVGSLVDELANSEPISPDEKFLSEWLYIVLAWVYDHRDSYADPLQMVENIYADFGYPENIKGFVRYMPMEGEDLGSREANENRLFERWRAYLKDESLIRKFATIAKPAPE